MLTQWNYIMSSAQALYANNTTLYPFAGAAQEGVRRLPPVLQFVVPVSSEVKMALHQVAQEQFAQGKSLDVICWEVYNCALSYGYYATIGVQEISSRNMPSFPGETVVASLLLVDLRPVEAAYVEPAQEELSAAIFES